LKKGARVALKDVGATLELALEHGQSSFEPGARVGGVAGWAARTAPARLELELRWTSTGPGGRDLRTVETLTFGEPQVEERRPFIIALPPSPYSFRGALITLEWTLELTAYPGGEKARLELTIAPGRRAVDLR
jgi:hypothetical protein